MTSIGTTQRGWVYFIGAGPGDPGLLTVRAADILSQATIVFYDRLVGDDIMEFISPQAELVNVGKAATAGGKTQLKINDLLVQAASENHIVARLKGGDPFVFGRGGEEALACHDANIPFEIVPGITSAIAAPAYAGIPVTHRGVSTNVCIVTGHGADDEEPDVDWQALGKGAGTLVILMGVGRIDYITGRLLAAGRSPKTPVALVRYGTRPNQETLVSTLEEVPDEVMKQGFRPPAAFIVGDCVGLRDSLQWLEQRPLFGLRAAVTRPAGEAEEINGALRAAGARVYRCPTIRTQSRLETPELKKALKRLPETDWVILTSVNGVRAFFDALTAAGLDARALAGTKVAAIGSKTAETLRAHGVHPDLTPGKFTQEGVLDAIGAVDGQRILLPRAAVARNVLPDTLAERGAQVDIVALYDTLPDEDGVARLRKNLEDKKIDLITFTSASTAQNLFSALPEADRAELLAPCKIAAIGPATREAIEKAGIAVDIEATTSTSMGLFEAILDHYRKSDTD